MIAYKNTIILLLTISVVSIFLMGCPGTQQTQAPPKPVIETKPPAPEKPAAKKLVLSFAIGSIDLTKGTGFRIERPHLEEMAAFAKKEGLDVVAMQGVARYPELKSRVDIVETFAAAANMAPAFGENSTISGRQTGNAIFTKFPIISQTNTPFTGISSTNFESALQATVDFGEQQIVIVSAELPQNAPRNDLATCLSALDQFRTMYLTNPIVAAGNFPHDDLAKQFAQFTKINPQGPAGAPRIWFSASDSMTVLHETIVQSPLGPATVAHLGLYR